MSWREEAKRQAALEAVKLVENDLIVGLGTGSTVYYAIEEIGRRIRNEGLKTLCIPTSSQTQVQAERLGIPLTNLNEYPRVDLAIDGADQVDPNLNLIKGGGGALTREKIVDSSTNFLAIVVDETKLTDKLGRKQSIPVEVILFALKTVMNRIKEMGGKPIVRLSGKTMPLKSEKYFMTDNGNLIIDADFGELKDAENLEKQIKMIPGVIENGLFINMTHKLYVGQKNGVKIIDKKSIVNKNGETFE